MCEEKTIPTGQRETGQPSDHPVKRFDKRQRTLASSGEHAAMGPTSASLSLVAKPVDPDLYFPSLGDTGRANSSKILPGPPVPSPRCLATHKRLCSEPEHSPDNSGQLSKRPRTDKDRHTEHWALQKCEWPKQPLEPDSVEHFIARSKTPSLRRTKSNGSSLNIASGLVRKGEE